jgi:hypothetical protein
MCMRCMALCVVSVACCLMSAELGRVSCFGKPRSAQRCASLAGTEDHDDLALCSGMIRGAWSELFYCTARMKCCMHATCIYMHATCIYMYAGTVEMQHGQCACLCLVQWGVCDLTRVAVLTAYCNAGLAVIRIVC